MRLFVGDDWAEDHHDVELMDQAGRVLARRRLPEGVAGMAGCTSWPVSSWARTTGMRRW